MSECNRVSSFQALCVAGIKRNYMITSISIIFLVFMTLWVMFRKVLLEWIQYVKMFIINKVLPEEADGEFLMEQTPTKAFKVA